VQFRIAQVERVHDHPDVGGVLAGHSHVRDLDQFERRFVHVLLEIAITLPVAVRFLHDDAAAEQQAFEDLLDVEIGILGIPHAERDVLEVAEHGHVPGFLTCHRVCWPSIKGRDCRRVAAQPETAAPLLR
jgi:hypothetical protein